MSSRKPGRFDEATRAKIIRSLRKGNFLSVAGARAGLGEKTANRWKSRGEREYAAAIAKADDGDPTITPYAQFYLDVVRADAKFEGRMLKVLKASKSPADARHVLANKYPDRWGGKNLHRVEYSGPGGGPIDVTIDARLAFARNLTASLEREGLAPTDPESGEDTGTEYGTPGPGEAAP